MGKQRREKRIVSALSMLLCVFLLLFSVRPIQHTVNPNIESVRETIAKTGRIVHAGGLLTTASGEKVAYTNSYNALDNMYRLGNRVCEIDIRQTGDNVLVCAHGDDRYLADGCCLPASATENEFLSVWIFDEFKPMSVQMLAQYMREHNDLLIITDIVHDDNLEICGRIARDYPDLKSRFIIQIYHEAEYEPVAELGFPYIIYTLYRADDDERNYWQTRYQTKNM